MDDDEDDNEDSEDDAQSDFESEIAKERLVPPPKRFFRMRELSYVFIAVLLVLVGLINVAMIFWFLSR